MNELKPCPFCGCKELDYGVMTGTMHGWTYVQCEECLAEIHVNSPLIKKAAEAWNRRAVNVGDTISRKIAKDTNVPSNDCISRQAALDALDVLCQEHRYKIPGKRETYSQYNEAWQDALDRAEGAIFNLPSAEPDNTCNGCRYERFGNRVCDQCSRFYVDRYEVKQDE